MNGADAVAGSLSVTMESDILYRVFGLGEIWTVYDKSLGMDFYILNNSEGNRILCLARPYNLKLNKT